SAQLAGLAARPAGGGERCGAVGIYHRGVGLDRLVWAAAQPGPNPDRMLPGPRVAMGHRGGVDQTVRPDRVGPAGGRRECDYAAAVPEVGPGYYEGHRRGRLHL